MVWTDSKEIDGNGLKFTQTSEGKQIKMSYCRVAHLNLNAKHALL